MEGKKSVGYSFSPVAIDGRRPAAATGSLSRGEGGKTVSRSRLLPNALSRSAELGSVGALFSLLLLGIRIVFRMCVWIRGAIMRLIPALPVFLALADGGAIGRRLLLGASISRARFLLSPSSSFPPYCVSPFAMFVFSFPPGHVRLFPCVVIIPAYQTGL